jgi:Xaa-Pro aminopeptidase
VQIITEGLMQLGILKGKSLDRLIADGDFRKFYMHKAGHWLGMDVHDVGSYKVDDLWRELEPGMVTTVEPGIYIPAGSGGVEERWWNIGVRIEDDVLVTATGHEVLTQGAPKTVEEIETLMARN